MSDVDEWASAVTVDAGRPVNVSQLSFEMGGAALHVIGSTVSALDVTVDALAAAVAAHVPVDGWVHPDAPDDAGDPDDDLVNGINGVSTAGINDPAVRAAIEQLKAVLTGKNRPAQVAGKAKG